MDDRVNILLVDDRPENLMALRAVLEGLGEHLVLAESGEAALVEVLRRDFAAILLDANMPGMDGYETAQLLRSRARNSATPIIFITANDPDRRWIARGYEAGAVDYIVKPFEPEILCSKVRVFINLWRKTMEVERQRLTLEKALAQQHELLEENQALERRLADRAAEAERRAEMLRILAIELTQTEQRERRRLAQVLHDHLQQLLVAALIKLGTLRKSGRPTDALDGQFAELRDLIRQAIQASRTLTIELSPPVLYDGGLAAALQWLARQMLEKHALTVDLDLQLTEDPPLEDLKIFIFQAARELLFNVRKHAGVDRARLSSFVRDGELSLVVEDQGRGFDADDLAIEAQLRETIGLVSIRERIKILGGRFEIESRPGKGTRVALRARLERQGPRIQGEACVPADDQAAQAASPADDAAAEPDTLYRLLIVDDHDILREGVATLLCNQPDMQVVAQARSGEEALGLIAEHRPDVVIMDLSLPGISGTEATRRILMQWPETRVIGLSMHDAAEMASILLNAGAEALLSKDEPSEHLISAIRQRSNGAVPMRRK